MEDVLEVYKRPYDPRCPVVCLDETSRQLLADTRAPLPCVSSQPQRSDYEYQREGTANVFLAFEPLEGKRTATVTERRTKVDWATFVQGLLDGPYADAEKVVLVMDNLNTHTPASLYEAFAPAEARRLVEKLEIHHTPKHGSWLNMAEVEFSVMQRQLPERLGTHQAFAQTVSDWTQRRNRANVRADWRFTSTDARIKLKRLYPCIQL